MGLEQEGVGREGVRFKESQSRGPAVSVLASSDNAGTLPAPRLRDAGGPDVEASASGTFLEEPKT